MAARQGGDLAVVLHGACVVRDLTEGDCVHSGTTKVWDQFSLKEGGKSLSLRMIQAAPGLSPGFSPIPNDDVLFCTEGRGIIWIGGHPYPLEADTAYFVPAHHSFCVRQDDKTPATLVSSQYPEPRPTKFTEPQTDTQSLSEVPPMARLWEQESQTSGERWYRVLLDRKQNSNRITQLVGAIPPGRAPNQEHSFDEVIVILRGVGRLWAGDRSTPLKPGSCVFLPKNQTHCIENTGADEVRLLGIFAQPSDPASGFIF